MNDRLMFDVETNGFLEKLTVIHSIVLKDVDTGDLYSYHGKRIPEGLARLAAAKMIIGHNVLKFDLPAIRKVYPSFTYKGIVVDTLLLSRLVFSDIKKQIDFDLQKKGRLPGNMMGKHSLESWGYRLGNYKGEYMDWCKANGIADPWAEWRPEMQTYCEQDVEVNLALFLRLLKRMENQRWRGECVSLEHDVLRIVLRQITYGFAFDETAATALHVELTKHRLRLEDELQKAFPPREIKTPFVPKANNKPRGYVKGVLTYKVRTEVFNPSSRPMIAERLKLKYGWEPTEFTEDGKPKMDEGTLEGLPWPEAKLLNEYFMVEKRLAALANGKQAWLKHVRNGAIHGDVDTMGTFTGRMSHKRPNTGQVPSCDVPYGKQCRALFVARKGRVVVGCDADALELRNLAHFMAAYDGGAYIETVLKGDKSKGTDMHSVNARAMGLDPVKKYTVGAIELAGREIAKTFFYAFIYGAGAEKLGTIIGKPRGAAARAAGAKLKASFLKGLPALQKLIDALTAKIKVQGFIYGIDGRTLPIRSAHAALNTLLQSAGAIVMKKALVILDGSLSRAGLAYGDDYEFVANVHDEFQIECKPEHADTVGKFAAEAIRAAGHHFNFRCPLDGQYKVGKSWAETH
jgi:DNA polymerase-1